ncbi:hypothetical protein KSU1_C0547 [Candidatus Jettenia caeni]|uniref:Uncharacterized protein n=1 Tax=Candidatus Jettenia caeni TaxID=247490 RepID=I3IK98_9BACT|nr:hypothetical protein KSU1_C0547 [Candidatus Jettenia caeni]
MLHLISRLFAITLHTLFIIPLDYREENILCPPWFVEKCRDFRICTKYREIQGFLLLFNNILCNEEHR